MPVHRHLHDKIGSVYAFRAELDIWARNRTGGAPGEGDEGSGVEPARGTPAPPPTLPPRRRLGIWLVGGTAAILATGLIAWQLRHFDSSPTDPLANARFQQLTDFGGTEQAAALSRDGRFVAFLSDRDGGIDVWVTQVGTGQFYNLTRGAAPELVNPSVRTLGFSPDGTLVTFWARRVNGSSQSEISIWGVPVLGGAPRPYLEGIAEFDWSSDGTRLVYHTPEPGDPMFLRDPDQPEARHIFSAPDGRHGHFPVWSPDQAFIYFVQGFVPDRLDLWRIRPTGGTPERITHHESRVSHPVFLSSRRLLYLASDSDGSGPWLHTLDVERRNPRRVSVGLERYTSLAASVDARRLVATVASPKGVLWRLPFGGTRVESGVRPIALTTRSGSSPRLGPGYLLYVSSKGESDSIWKLEGDVATDLWSAPATRIIGAPAIARDGGRIAFSARRNRQTSLHVANADGTNARTVTTALELQGAPAWAPDGQSLTVAAVADGSPRLFSVPLDGRPPAPFVAEYSVDPVWSPDGDLVVYSGPDIGTTFSVKAVTADATASPLPTLTLSRGARRLSFMPGEGRSLVVLRGEIGHKNLWLVDLDTGVERQLTNFAQDFSVRDFDISPDGREMVLEQVQEDSHIVLIELHRP